MPERNVELLEEVASIIEAHPDEYDQASYFTDLGHDVEPGCGTVACTVACIAGWAVLRGLNCRLGPDGTLLDGNGEQIGGVRHLATVLLGLTTEEAGTLFSEWFVPEEGLTVPDALRCIAAGHDVDDVAYSVGNIY